MPVSKDWESPKKIHFAVDIVQRGGNSSEVSAQQARESQFPSIIYVSEGKIPSTPQEPDELPVDGLSHEPKVIPLYDVGSEAFQLSQLLSQVSVASFLAPELSSNQTTDCKLQPSSPSGPRECSVETQDPPYDPDNPEPDMLNSSHTSQYRGQYSEAGEESYSTFQGYSQNSQEQYDTYQPYYSNYDQYQGNEYDSEWDRGLSYDERQGRCTPGKKSHKRGRSRGRTGPNLNNNRWKSGDDLATNTRSASAPCKFYAEGNCRYGEKCRFSHQLGRDR
ncbi:hypothetical protein K493DRAFT_39461 [Basidiobolus meristosporus CBS 931.73]|uniref:C3H1-type domain-containing protein n=1 Tax=Basidiobolus meristosporus CBS 931.73 TaxID=1314790 RepID=A0A1Y1Y4R9_9FUNG|nr:hypothetical protein K493DRAFT_39461 [Basidiobolus meristosporus CBS 931.73]|eukprot:ORX92978.1 hypothetical protein K493DRAFT_39461 [Basidiobolus meristosporus CBS 931.73]